MKKIFALLLATALLACLLCACGDDSGQKKDDKDDKNDTTPSVSDTDTPGGTVITDAPIGTTQGGNGAIGGNTTTNAAPSRDTNGVTVNTTAPTITEGSHAPTTGSVAPSTGATNPTNPTSPTPSATNGPDVTEDGSNQFNDATFAW